MSSSSSDSVPEIKSPGKSDYFWLYLSRGLVLVTGLLVYRWASTILGHDGFSEYTLARRTIGILSPPLVLGLGVALPRRIAMMTSSVQTESRLSCFWSAFWALLAVHILFLAVIFLLPGVLSGLFFGSDEWADLILPLGLFLTGLSWHALIWAYLRGLFKFRSASILEMVNLVLLPIVGFLVFSTNTRMLLSATGIMVSLVCLVITLFMASRTRWDFGEFSRMGKDLLSYGIPRVPGDLALGALLGLPSMVVAHLMGVTIAGYVAFGSTFLGLAGTAVAPLSTALLPRASSLIKSNQYDLLYKEVRRLFLLSLALGLVLVGIAELLMEPLVLFYLGDGFEGAVPILQIIALCVVPYILFAVLRNVVDAAHHKAINTRNILIALLVFGVGSLAMHMIRPGVQAILIGTLLGHLALFALTFKEVRAIFKRAG